MAEVSTFGGINNVDDNFALILGHKGFMELNTGLNIDLTDARKITRRSGYSEIAAGETSYLWASDQYCFYVQDTVLYRLHLDDSTEVIATGVNDPVYYARLFDYVLISYDGSTYKYDGELTLITVPAPSKLNIDESPGPLPPGRYRFKLTLMDDTGREFSITPYEMSSVATTPSQFQVTGNVSIYTQNVYMTTFNGDTFYNVGSISPGDTTLQVSNISEYLQLDLLDTMPLSDSRGMMVFNGRVYYISGKAVMYSEIYNPLLMKASSNFYLFPEDVTTIIPVDTGIYVSADKTYFISGLDPDITTMREVDPFPIIPGTALNTTHATLEDVDTSGTQGMWRTREGVILGTNAGNIYKLTRDKVATPDFTEGAALIRREVGKSQYVTSLVSAGSDSARFSATDTITGEIRRNGITIS